MINEFSRESILLDRVELVLENLNSGGSIRQATIDNLGLEENYTYNDVKRAVKDNISGVYENEWIDFVELWDENMKIFYKHNLINNKLHILLTDENCNEKEYVFDNYDDFISFHTGLFSKMEGCEVDYSLYTIYELGVYLVLESKQKTIEINIKPLEEK